MNYYILKGALHIHTVFSDGTSSVEEIAKLAHNAGLDWIIITDHNTMQAKEGMYGDVAVITGEEITPDFCNHYLAFDIKNTIMPDDNPQIYIDEVRAQGGFGFMAHPDESDLRKNNAKPLKWINKDILGDGTELWNWFSSWADNLDSSNIFSLAYAYFFKHRLVKAPSDKTIMTWDKENNLRDTVFPAIAGIDAHALIVKKYIIPLKIFSYKTMLNTLCNCVCLKDKPAEDFQSRKNQILTALKTGANIMYNRHICKKEPVIYVKNNNTEILSGGTINLDENTYLFINTDKKVLMKIFLNGKKIKEITENLLKLKITSGGKYRVELYYRNEIWAYSNPFIVL